MGFVAAPGFWKRWGQQGTECPCKHRCGFHQINFSIPSKLFCSCSWQGGSFPRLCSSQSCLQEGPALLPRFYSSIPELLWESGAWCAAGNAEEENPNGLFKILQCCWLLMLLVIHGLPHLMEKASWSGEILSHEAPLAVPGCCWLLSFNLKILSIARINQTGFGFFFYFNQQRGAGVGRNHQVKHREHPQVVIWLCKCRLEATCGFLGHSSDTPGAFPVPPVDVEYSNSSPYCRLFLVRKGCGASKTQ